MAIRKIDSIVDLKKTGAEFEEFGNQIEKAYGKIVNLYNMIDKLKGTTTLSGVIKDAKDIDAAVKTADDGVKELTRGVAKLEIAESKLGKQIAENKVLLQQANKEQKNRATIALTEAGSISRLEAVVVRLRASQKALNLETEEGRAKNEKYIKSIDFLNEKIKANSDAATKQRLNVGNYQGSAKIIVDALEKQKQKLEELEKAKIRVQNAGAGSFNPGNVAATRTTIIGFAGGSQNNAALNKIAESATSADKAIEMLNEEIERTRNVVEGFSRVTDNDKFLNIAGKVGDANAEIKFFTKSLIDLERQGLGNADPSLQEIKERLAELTD